MVFGGGGGGRGGGVSGGAGGVSGSGNGSVLPLDKYLFIHLSSAT